MWSNPAAGGVQVSTRDLWNFGCLKSLVVASRRGKVSEQMRHWTWHTECEGI